MMYVDRCLLTALLLGAFGAAPSAQSVASSGEPSRERLVEALDEQAVIAPRDLSGTIFAFRRTRERSPRNRTMRTMNDALQKAFGVLSSRQESDGSFNSDNATTACVVLSFLADGRGPEDAVHGTLVRRGLLHLSSRSDVDTWELALTALAFAESAACADVPEVEEWARVMIARLLHARDRYGRWGPTDQQPYPWITAFFASSAVWTAVQFGFLDDADAVLDSLPIRGIDMQSTEYGLNAYALHSHYMRAVPGDPESLPDAPVALGEVLIQDYGTDPILDLVRFRGLRRSGGVVYNKFLGECLRAGIAALASAADGQTASHDSEETTMLLAIKALNVLTLFDWPHQSSLLKAIKRKREGR